MFCQQMGITQCEYLCAKIVTIMIAGLYLILTVKALQRRFRWAYFLYDRYSGMLVSGCLVTVVRPPTISYDHLHAIRYLADPRLLVQPSRQYHIDNLALIYQPLIWSCW